MSAMVPVSSAPSVQLVSMGSFDTLSVLVVEDDIAIQDLLVSFLQKDPWVQVTAVGSGEAAVEAFRETAFDVVFMDVMLPGMLGTEAARCIADIARDRGDWLYLTYVTGGAIAPEDFAILARGVCDIITKPVLLPALMARLQTVRELESARRYAVDSQLRLKSMMEQSIDGFVLISAADIIMEANRSAERIMAAAPGHLVGKSVRHFLSEEEGARYDAFVADSAFSVQQGSNIVQMEVRRLDGKPCTVEIRLNEVHLPHEGRCLAAAFRDVTERVAYDNTIQYVATHDSLTGLPNRRLMQDRLNQALALARRHKRSLALLFIDLDGFKMVNDTYGHAAGDKVLLEVAHRFKNLARDSDTVSRQGGDEFVVILAEIADEADAELVAHRFAEAACTPVQDGKRLYQVGASIGVATYPGAGLDAETLMRHADMAMYHVKEQGKGSVLNFSAAMREAASRKIQLENELHDALRNDEFVLHYQPQLCFKSDALIGVEALIRWRKHGKLIFPDKFISAAEENGLIVPIGEWAVSEAARQIAEWREAYGWSPTISVNITANGFADRLVKHLEAVLEEHDLPPNSLALELTESMLATDVDDTVRSMTALQAMGVSISLDDFGTGYSAMAHLRRYPMNALKIDRAFIAALSDKRDAAIAETILTIARSLNMKTVAEGVETQDQFEWLRSMGCDAWQGYLASPPKPPEEVVRMYPEAFGQAPAK